MTLCLLIASLAGATAQTRPDFSGEWILNRQDSSLSPAAAAIQSGLLRWDGQALVLAFVLPNGFEGGAGTRTMCGYSSAAEALRLHRT